MIDLYSVGPDKTHFAIVAYSNWARVEFHLNTLTGSSLTSQGYKELVDKIRFQRGFTFIDKALLVADKDVFTTARGMRPELPQVRLSSSFCFVCISRTKSERERKVEEGEWKRMENLLLAFWSHPIYGTTKTCHQKYLDASVV